jgi:hypothetical protein
MLATATLHLSASSAERVRAHLYSQLLCLGRHTITGLLTTQGRIHQDWSADYRLYSQARLEPEVLFDCALHAVEQKLGPGKPLVVALDDSLLRKRGPHVHGVRWSRDPLGPPFAVNLVRAQRVVQLSAALPTSPAQARMVPVDFVHAPLPAKPKASASAQEQAAYVQAKASGNINAVAAARLTRLAAKTDRPVLAVCDGRFANRRFLRAAPKTAEVITRIRKDCVLHFAPEAGGASTERAPLRPSSCAWMRVPPGSVYVAGPAGDSTSSKSSGLAASALRSKASGPANWWSLRRSPTGCGPTPGCSTASPHTCCVPTQPSPCANCSRATSGAGISR